MQNGFEKIKDLFSDSNILYYPDPKKPYYLETDASNYALGAVLYQKNEKQEKEIVTLARRTLKGPEIAYFTTEKELLAIVWALQKFRTYLQGAKIINRTDHMALTFLKTCKFVNARLTRWILAIQDYNITVEHCPRKENTAADLLSRQHPDKDWEKERNTTEILINELKYECSEELKTHLRSIKQAQKEDKWVTKQAQELEKCKGETTRFKLQNDIIVKKGKDGHKIYLPKNVVDTLITECHQAYGHIGAGKTH